jgi:DNA-binding beta-propeller fold protein YncE
MSVLALAAMALSPGQAFGQDVNVTVASKSGDFAMPVDATPDADGTTFYFTAISPSGPAVFRVPALGGTAIPIAAGAPFVSPAGISISSDGRDLYIADPLAWAGGGRLGQIFVIPVGGGTPRVLSGAEGRGPHAIEVALDGGRDAVYFTGYNPSNRTPGIYKIPPSGGTAVAVVEGAPLVEPDSVAVGRSGTVYYTDRGANAVCKIMGGIVSRVVDFIRPGNPAGIAVSLDESRLLVSTLQPYRNRAQVLVVDLSTLEVSAATDVVGKNPGAGGLHRARDIAIYAWCGAPMGPVYKVMTSGMVF